MPKKLNLPKEKIVIAPANIIKRILAFAFDLILISFIIYPLESILRSFVPETASYTEALALMSDPANLSLITTVTVAISIIALIYFTVLEYKFSQTIGKTITRLYVVSDYKKLNFWQCLVRNIFLLPFIPFILLWVIDPLYVFFTKENKRFSDVLAKTKVIEKIVM